MALQVGSTRGGGQYLNGKVSKTTSEVADILTRPGYRWSSNDNGVANVTFAFRASAAESDPGSFSRFSEAAINFTVSMLTSWSDVANVKFHRVGTGSVGDQAYSNDATILFSNYVSSTDEFSAFAYLPGQRNAKSDSGDVYVNLYREGMRNLDYLSFARMTLTHEVGHALGLDHPGDYNGGTPTYGNNANYAEDTRQYSVMSYFDASNTGGSTRMYASSPLMDDIAAVQKLYGANMSTRTGSTVYGFNSTADRDWFSASVNGVTRSVIFCVWDAGGNDTFDFSGYGQDQVIDLRAGSFSNVGGLVGNVSIAVGVTIEKAIGGSGADTLIGNSADNTLVGGAGNDVLDGGRGFDKMLGGLGDDTYVVDDIDDRVTELAAEGTDTVKSSVTYSLTSNVENLTLTGSAAINGTGNGLGNIIVGNSGANVLSGGGGKDVLTGGGGADQFMFSAVSDSGLSATDRITDFNWVEGDLIDLSRIDANSALAGDQAFSFVKAFSKQAGQATLAYDAASNTSTFSGDVNGDGVADFVLQIAGKQDASHGWML